MSIPTEQEVIADAVSMAKYRYEQLKAAAEEDAKWNARRKILVTALPPKAPLDPNAVHKHYWVPGHRVAHGETISLELSEREIHNMKVDPFVKVDDSAEALAAFHAPADVTKSIKVETVDAPVEEVAPVPAGVPAAAAEGLQELQSTKKGKK